VEFLPGKDGLVHISDMANFRESNEDIVKLAMSLVKCLWWMNKARVKYRGGGDDNATGIGLRLKPPCGEWMVGQHYETFVLLTLGPRVDRVG